MIDDITLNETHILTSIASIIFGIIITVSVKIYKTGKQKGRDQTTLNNLDRKIDEIKNDLKENIQESKKEHDLIRDEVKQNHTKIDLLSNKISEIAGKFSIFEKVKIK